MALSRMHKGITALAVALVAVIAIGYGGLKYLESSVVESIRTWAQQTPPDRRVELGEVRYSLLNNRLFLADVQVAYMINGEKAQSTLATIEIDNPDSVFLEALANPEIPLKQPIVPVADRIAFTNVRVTTKVPAEVAANIDLAGSATRGAYTKIEIDLAQARELFKSDFDTQKFMMLFSYASAELDELAVTVTGLPFKESFRMSIGSVTARDYVRGKVASTKGSNILCKLGEMEIASMAEMSIEGVTPPAEELVNKINALDPDKNSEEVLNLIGELLAGPEPLFKKFEIQGLKMSVPGNQMALARLTLTNPTTTPYTCSVDMQNLVLPTDKDELQGLKLIGLDTVDLSSSFSLVAPNKDGDFKSALSLTIARLGTVDFRIDGMLPPGLKESLFEASRSGSTDAAVEAAVAKLKIERVEAGYKDDGLLSRSATLAQTMLGMTPEQSIEYSRKYLEDALADDSENPEVINGYVNKIVSVLERPGSLRLSFIAPKPMSAQEIEALPVPSPYEKLEAFPGPKTLAEQMAELNK